MAGKLVIKINGFGQGTVELDGTDISSTVHAVEFRAGANEHLAVTLELLLSEVEVTALGDSEKSVMVNLTDSIRTTLSVLGWTAPADDQTVYRMPMTEWVPVEERVRTAEALPDGCRCFELNHHRQYYADGSHDDRCPLFVIDNASPDAND